MYSLGYRKTPYYSPWKVGIGAVACNTGCYRRRSPVTPGVTGARRQVHRELQADQSEATKSISWPLIGPPVIPGGPGAWRL